MGIRKRVYSLLLIVFVPILLLEIFIYSQWFQMSKQTEMQANLELARAVGKNFETFLDGLIRNELAVGLALTNSRPPTAKDRDRLLGTIQSDNPAVYSIFLLDASGTVTASSLQGLIGVDLSDRSFYRKVKEGQEWAVNELVIGRSTGKPIFTIGRAIRDDEGRLIGIAAAGVDPEGLDRVLGITRTKGAGVSLIDNKGMHVYRYPPIDYSWEQRNWLESYPIIEESLRGKEVVTTVESKTDGKIRLAAFTPVSSIGWVVTCSRAEDEVVRDINNTMLPIGIVMLLVTLTAFGAAMGLSRPITASILRLRAHAVALGKGKRNSLDIASGPRELKELGIAFNQMADKVQTREDELRRARDELEQRVAMRTEELRKAYNQLVDHTREREKLEEHLRQAQKMEAIGTLAGGIAHDFNNMLAIIMGNTELALDDVGDNKGTARNLERIMQATKRARDLVRHILTFSRKTEIGKDVVSVTSVIEETFKLLRGTIPSTIRMDLDVKTEKDSVVADPSQIQQIFMNLATNAAYAMREDGGILTVAIGDVTFTNDTLPDNEMQPGTYVKLTVQDTGPGIREEDLPRIFEPFFTTKEVGQGTGMGLAVVYGIVKSHGGAVTALNLPGRGATFDVLLPHAASGEKKPQGERPDVFHGKERILLVDDEPAVVEASADTLRRLGYSVTTALSGPRAWGVFEKDPNGFDLVITDQTMPDLSGLGLAAKILAVREDIPIILFTGYSEAVSPEKAQAAGIKGFVMKPVDKRELAEIVRWALKGGSRIGTIS